MNALNMKFSHEPFQSESQKVQEKVQLAETSEET